MPQKSMALFQSYSHRKFVNEKHIDCSKLFVLVNVKVRLRGRHHVLYTVTIDRELFFRVSCTASCSLLITSFDQ